MSHWAIFALFCLACLAEWLFGLWVAGHWAARETTMTSSPPTPTEENRN